MLHNVAKFNLGKSGFDLGNETIQFRVAERLYGNVLRKLKVKRFHPPTGYRYSNDPSNYNYDYIEIPTKDISTLNFVIQKDENVGSYYSLFFTVNKKWEFVSKSQDLPQETIEDFRSIHTFENKSKGFINVFVLYVPKQSVDKSYFLKLRDYKGDIRTFNFSFE